MKAIVLAADHGFAIEGVNEHLPKALLELDGKPMIAYVLEALAFIDPKDITIVVGYEKNSVVQRLGDSYQYAVQEESLGTGHAVSFANIDLMPADEDVLVCYSDMPLITKDVYKGVIDKHVESRADCTVLTAIAPKSTLQYGRIIRENERLADIVEYDAADKAQRKIDELNMGIYVFKAGRLQVELQKLLAQPAARYPLTRVPRGILADGGRLESFSMQNSNQIYGINNADQLSLAHAILQHSKEVVKQTPQKWFGTGGWRAFIGEDFTKANVCLLVQAISTHLRSQGQHEVVVGYDRRFLSDKAAVWAAEVFAANGVNVFFIGRIAPTPLVMFTVKNMKADLGISITASHNPADYNGIKVFLSDSSDAPVEVTNAFEKQIAQGLTVKSIPFHEGIDSGIIRIIDPNNDYIDSIIAMIDMGAIRKANLRILLDPMFGVSKTTLQTVLMTARADVDIINDRHDTLFGGQLPSPTAESLQKLRNMVVQNKYDLGIGTDGDADRIGIVDDKGNYAHPNKILVMLYHYMLKYKGERGDCVRNLATTQVLDVIAKRYGQTCHEVPVGFKNISAKMSETDALIGGESSGGLTIRGHIKGKDGIFASSLVVEMICVTGKTIPALLQEIEDEYGQMHQVEFEASFSESQKQTLIDKLFVQKETPHYDIPIARIGYIDGCKIYFENNGWIVARFSGTEPLIRVFAEMPTEAEARNVIDVMVAFLGL